MLHIGNHMFHTGNHMFSIGNHMFHIETIMCHTGSHMSHKGNYMFHLGNSMIRIGSHMFSTVNSVFRIRNHVFSRRKSYVSYRISYVLRGKKCVSYRNSYVSYRKSYVSHRKLYVFQRKSYVSHRKSYVSHRETYISHSADAWARGEIWSVPEQVFQDLARHIRNQANSVADLINQVDSRRGQFQALQAALQQTHSLASDRNVSTLGFLATRHPAVIRRLRPYLSEQELAQLALPDDVADQVDAALPVDATGRVTWPIHTGADLVPPSANGHTTEV